MADTREVMELLQLAVFNAEVPWSAQRARLAAALLARSPDARVAVDAVEVGGVACRRLTPEGATAGRTVVYAHGGGYCIGSPAMGDALGERVALALGATWLGVDFRLAPEHPVPAAADDVAAVLRAVPGSAALGDSAGAGALVAAIGAGAPALALVLVCPWLDLTVAHDDPGEPPLSGAWLAACAGAYAPSGADGPVASPGRHPWRVVVPTLVVGAAADPLVGDARALVGEPGVEVREHAGAPHDFALLVGADATADAAADDVVAFVRAVTGWGPAGSPVTR